MRKFHMDLTAQSMEYQLKFSETDSSYPVFRRHARIVVSVESPHIVLRADSGVVDLLGYTTEEICGRSIKILHGPRTDAVILHSAIKNVAFSQSCPVQATLYSRTGQELLVMATCSPYQESDGMFVGCLLDIEDSEAVTLKQALASDNPVAMAIITASRPHTIETVSAEFSELFGLNQSQVLGRTLRLIHGPAGHTQTHRWSSMLDVAARGHRAYDRLFTCSSACVEAPMDIACTPIVEPLTGRVSHLLVEFRPDPRPARDDGPWHPAQQDLMEPDRHPCEPQQCGPSGSAGRHCGPAASEGDYPAHSHQPMHDPFPPFAPGPARAAGHWPLQSADATSWLCGPPLQPCSAPFTFSAAPPSFSSLFAPPPAGGGDAGAQRAMATSICPRRKTDAAAGDAAPAPVAITLEVLESCAEMPLYEAAKRMVAATHAHTRTHTLTHTH